MIKRAAVLVAAAVLAAPLALDAQTIELPTARAGLWEVSMEMMAGVPPVKTQMCIDGTMNREMMAQTLKNVGQDCKMDLKRQGSTYVMDTDCKVSGMTVKTKSTMTGDFQSSYTVRIEGTMDPGGGKPAMPVSMTQTAKWKSADCGSLKPGDVVMPGGIKVNVKEMKSLPQGGTR
jgi:hypothetical protein